MAEVRPDTFIVGFISPEFVWQTDAKSPSLHLTAGQQLDPDHVVESVNVRPLVDIAEPNE
jgi:hypothetical protein